MLSTTVSQLQIFPLKSAAPLNLQEAVVEQRGLQADRRWAIFDSSMQVITARDHPKLLKLITSFDKGCYHLSYEDQHMALETDETSTSEELMLFMYPVCGLSALERINEWLSKFLRIPCKLYFMSEQQRRPVLSKHGGQPNDYLNFADQAPILLVSSSSVDDLNLRLDKAVSQANFRPNIVVNHPVPYAEDHWKMIKIGSVLFEVIQACERCVFVTIDPHTHKKNPQQEPLRTLTQYRKGNKGGVNFGVHLVPRSLGKLHIGDPLEIIDQTSIVTEQTEK